MRVENNLRHRVATFGLRGALRHGVAEQPTREQSSTGAKYSGPSSVRIIGTSPTLALEFLTGELQGSHDPGGEEPAGSRWR